MVNVAYNFAEFCINHCRILIAAIKFCCSVETSASCEMSLVSSSFQTSAVNGQHQLWQHIACCCNRHLS